MDSSLRSSIEQSAQRVSCGAQRRPNGDIGRSERDQRFSIGKESKFPQHEQLHIKAAGDEAVYAKRAHAQQQHPRHPQRRPSAPALRGAPRGVQHTVPMQAKMQPGQHERPHGGGHVNPPANCAQAQAEKIEHMARYKDGAGEDGDHRQHEQPIHNGQQRALRRVPALEQPAMPAAVERVMREEQQAQRRARPFMQAVVHQVITHLPKEQRRHGDIHTRFACGFYLHCAHPCRES